MKKTGILAMLLLTGCFTTYETPYPVSACTKAPSGHDTTVRLNGFAATVTEFVPVHGYGTVMGGGGWHYDAWGHVWGSPMETRVVHTSTYVPQTHETDAYLKQAENLLEESGFVVKSPNPDWLVEVEFQGPVRKSGDAGVRALWLLCSILSCDYGVETRTAKLKIYDNHTGRLVHHRDFEVRYQVTMWSPIPLFGPASYDRTSASYKQNWCLSALTDQCVAEATSWLAARK